ncbi:MAG: SPFH domain-containing protein [Mycobacterium sp.]|nr:SPFH domain-containing protein [Mycobacterium sp.]
MGLLKAAGSAVAGVLADQWKDFYTVADGVAPTAALFPAVRRGTNLGRGSNTRGSVDVITNGSTIVVPQGYGLVFMEGGAFTAFVAEPGVYEWSSGAHDSRSVFAGGNLLDPLVTASWERFKYGGRPAAQQRAFFVSLQELTNNKFGTASDIYWDDRYLNAQVGASARGTYTLRITDPLLFIHNFVPASYLQNGAVFDFTDLRNAAADQLFNEVIASLSTALSAYTNDPARGNRIIGIQQDAAGFARCLAQAVEANYHWRSERGLEIVSTALVAIDYDAPSRELLKAVQRADALTGVRATANLRAATAAGIEAAGANAGTDGLIGIGLAADAVGIHALEQPATADPADDHFATLAGFKRMLDAGLITQDDYNTAKAKALGL